MRIFRDSIAYKDIEVENTYAEAFKGLYLRILVTAERGLDESDRMSPWLEDDELRWIAYRATATPAIVVGRHEAGIEMWLSKDRTPDGREGVVLQYWYMYREDKPMEAQVDRFWREVSIRIRQDVMSCSGGTSRVFNWLPEGYAMGRIDTYELVGKCGGGYERVERRWGRDMIVVPLMSGFDFEIERYLTYGVGVSGAAIWVFCEDVKSCRRACRDAVKRLQEVEGVVAPFGACPSGSLPENYPPIGPPTNYYYCPSLKNMPFSRLPRDVNSVYEIVINGMTLDHVKRAIKVVIDVVSERPGVLGVSAGNYGGRLGQYRIYLSDVIRS